MAPSSKTNYKSFDAQARLLRAIVAAHPEVKWNYKDIAECYGSDMTPDALNHRFRHLRAESVIIGEARKQGFDMRDLAMDGLPKTQNAVSKDNIAQYFGASTAEGIGFQFRSIKKDGKAMKKAAETGGDPQQVPIFDGASTPRATPSKKTAPSTTTTTTTPGSRKRKTPIKAEIVSDDEDNSMGSMSQDYSEMDETPTKKAKAAGVQKTPGRGAKAKAAQKTMDENTSASNSDVGGDVGVAPVSIFGNPAPNAPAAFSNGAVDDFIGGGGGGGGGESFGFSNGFNYSYEGDGEI